MTPIRSIYSGLKKQHSHVNHDWWPTSGKFIPQQFEIVVGAFLTQNTNWRNVEKALANLIAAKKLTAAAIANTPLPELRRLVKPSGFYRQKSKRLRELCRFIEAHDDFYGSVTREELLALTGIGRETADSILLYACGKLYFVVDAYTRRLLVREKLITGKEKYDALREMFESSLPKKVNLYKEFHALIVENEKFYRRSLARNNATKAITNIGNVK